MKNIFNLIHLSIVVTACVIIGAVMALFPERRNNDI